MKIKAEKNFRYNKNRPLDIKRNFAVCKKGETVEVHDPKLASYLEKNGYGKPVSDNTVIENKKDNKKDK